MNKLIIVLATVAHLLPHPFSVSSVGATALYAGAHSRSRYYWLVPGVPLLAAALMSGFYDPTVMAFVFSGFALSSLAGRRLLASRRSYPRYGMAVAAGATIFFLTSNFSIWLVGMYPPTWAGLVECYVNALPYLARSALADAAWCFVLFGLHARVARRQPSTAPA